MREIQYDDYEQGNVNEVEEVITDEPNVDSKSTTSTQIPTEVVQEMSDVERNANSAGEINEEGETIYNSTTTGSPLTTTMLEVESKEDYPEFSALEAEQEDSSDIADE